jgi:hypothetical protein
MVCMRLSLKRAAHVLLASSARQEIRVGMTRGEWYFPLGWRLGWTEYRSGCSATTADPSVSLGMTRGEWLLSVRLATWMDGI